MAGIILVSKSPRRQELLQKLGYEFTVQVKESDESYPEVFTAEQAVCHIAKNKAQAFVDESRQHIIISADTIVVLDDQILGKPKDRTVAIETLQALSGRSHRVLTACCILYMEKFNVFYETTTVQFKTLNDKEIYHYVDHYKPFDKAGSYGIQEWIGMIGITKIEGSYTNVVGLPTARLHNELQKMLS